MSNTRDVTQSARRSYGGHPPESDGDLAQDVDQEVVVILPLPEVKRCLFGRHLHDLEDELVRKGVERRHGGGQDPR